MAVLQIKTLFFHSDCSHRSMFIYLFMLATSRDASASDRNPREPKRRYRLMVSSAESEPSYFPVTGKGGNAFRLHEMAHWRLSIAFNDSPNGRRDLRRAIDPPRKEQGSEERGKPANLEGNRSLFLITGSFLRSSLRHEELRIDSARRAFSALEREGGRGPLRDERVPEVVNETRAGRPSYLRHVKYTEHTSLS